VTCTQSNATPTIDTVLSVAALGVGVAGIVIGSQPSAPCTPGTLCLGIDNTVKTGELVGGIGLVASAVALAFSAGYGYSTTAECRELSEAQLACVSGVEESCRRLAGSTKSDGKRPNVGAPCHTNADCTGGTVCNEDQWICAKPPMQ
jgi:hypothetical protein